MIKFVTGDLTDATEKYIVHQTNCVSHYAAGIATAIFDKFPYANVYAGRVEEDRPGNIVVCGNGKDQRYVVNLMGQFYPGGIHQSIIDDERARRDYFYKGLLRLANIDNLESVAFNYRIGCGIAGGDWEWYKGTIENFSKFVFEDQGAITTIYQREGDI
jgi:O-acetyl-ADP-ribose deacetylase (regulator of RNase III)